MDTPFVDTPFVDTPFGPPREKGAERVAGEVPVKQPEKQPKQSKQLFFDCFPDVFGCFQCWALGTPVDGHRDCNPNIDNPLDLEHT